MPEEITLKATNTTITWDDLAECIKDALADFLGENIEIELFDINQGDYSDDITFNLRKP